MVSNLGWALGYLGGLISLALVFVILSRKDKTMKSLENQYFVYWTFVGFWTFIFGIKHITKFRNKFFVIENLKIFFNFKEHKYSYIF